MSAYQELIEALSDIVYYYDRHYAANAERRGFSETQQKALDQFWANSFPKVRKAADSGAFLFSDSVNSSLEQFIDCNTRRHNSYDEYLDENWYQAQKCLEEVVLSSKVDLKVKGPWL